MLELRRCARTGRLKQALALVIIAVRDQQPGAAPDFGRGRDNLQTLGGLLQGEQAAGTQALVATWEGIGAADARDHGCVKAPALT